MKTGTFILADIGGYTSFLSDVGIQHAKEITGHLLNGMFKIGEGTWELGDVEGDCLFLFTETNETPADIYSYLRTLYENFRESIEEIVSGSTCGCGACDRSGGLTVKFVVHRGEFDIEAIAGQRQLIGREVVVAHRLLKNSVPVPEYALITNDVPGVAEASGHQFVSTADTYGDVGKVEYSYVDFQQVRDAYLKSRARFLSDEEADVVSSVVLPASLDAVWAIVNDPQRMVEAIPTLIKLEPLIGSLDETGSVHTCLHGDSTKIVHYRLAFERTPEVIRATDRLSNVPFLEKMLQTWELSPVEAGTRCTFFYSIKPGTQLPDASTRTLALETIRQRAEGDLNGLLAACSGAPSVV